MTDAFSRVSLIVDVSGEWYKPDTLVIRQPSKYKPRRSRPIMHETLHWWQQLGHGFMTWLAAEEWERLLAYEAALQMPRPGPRKVSFVAKDEQLGFSTSILNEALTRYWETHICGPIDLLRLERSEERWRKDEELWDEYRRLERTGRLTGPDGTGYSDLAYALAMRGAGGRYALPYQLVVDLTSTKAAGIVFPIAAHLAFQTSHPNYYFREFLEILTPHANRLPPGAIESLWIDFFFTARALILQTLRDAEEQVLMPIAELRETKLKEHPGYADTLREMERYASQQLFRTALGQEVRRRYPELAPPFAGLVTLDIMLATPGIPDHRGTLYQMFPPPLVRFSDAQTWLLGYVHRSEARPEWTDEERGLPRWKRLAEDAQAIDERWKKMLHSRYETK